MVKQKHLTIFAIFELMDQNRDEGTGNFQTLKKVKRLKEVYTFISRYSFRHHLFNTLKETAGWKEASVRLDKQGKEKAVIQFDLVKDDIFSSEELDAFGYMFTIKEKKGNKSEDKNQSKEENKKGISFTRKMAVGRTDLISLEPYYGDSAFYANISMTERAKKQGIEANPDIFGKEEHFALYKGGITINLNKLGIDEWIVDEKPSFKEESHVLEIKLLKNDKEGKYVKKLENCKIVNSVSEYFKSLEEKYTQLLENKEYYETEKGLLIVGKIKNSNKFKIVWLLNEKEKAKRVKDLLDAFLKGIKFQVGGADYALEPIFLIVAIMDSPIQIFFPHISVEALGRGKYKVIGLEAGIYNRRVIKAFIEYSPSRIILDTCNTAKAEIFKRNEKDYRKEVLKSLGFQEQIVEEVLKEDSNNEG